MAAPEPLKLTYACRWCLTGYLTAEEALACPCEKPAKRPAGT